MPVQMVLRMPVQVVLRMPVQAVLRMRAQLAQLRMQAPAGLPWEQAGRAPEVYRARAPAGLPEAAAVSCVARTRSGCSGGD